MIFIFTYKLNVSYNWYTHFFPISKEEEMKRFQQALSEDGAYNSVAFSYDYSAPENSFHYPQSVSSYETTSREGLHITEHFFVCWLFAGYDCKYQRTFQSILLLCMYFRHMTGI